ncbi:MAG: hypothetical protein H6566_29245 [Lewinellaceae bacterium]|nr:hypothetical protein [Lewinellaceae bacterium]
MRTYCLRSGTTSLFSVALRPPYGFQAYEARGGKLPISSNRIAPLG